MAKTDLTRGLPDKGKPPKPEERMFVPRSTSARSRLTYRSRVTRSFLASTDAPVETVSLPGVNPISCVQNTLIPTTSSGNLCDCQSKSVKQKGKKRGLKRKKPPHGRLLTAPDESAELNFTRLRASSKSGLISEPIFPATEKPCPEDRPGCDSHP